MCVCVCVHARACVFFTCSLYRTHRTRCTFLLENMRYIYYICHPSQGLELNHGKTSSVICTCNVVYTLAKMHLYIYVHTIRMCVFNHRYPLCDIRASTIYYTEITTHLGV